MVQQEMVLESCRQKKKNKEDKERNMYLQYDALASLDGVEKSSDSALSSCSFPGERLSVDALPRV